ncbi:ATP-binding cassette domain-containing protein [Lactobacillus helveticus]|uniref:ATP-binding cassette domain-containing protein n=1 Tax=Lactobacillus helveticus TaxID=1587 RepID=UPI00187BB268|nr:ATP-binding cassette domain-containing protein [Lactobacillus helveticus]MBN6049619.1 ATP-binding cassette domain-containing protein [Lactobacillus helveticus]
MDEISFSVYKGEIVALVGHNGVGKTTLMKCILGTTGYDKGIKIFEGNKIKNKQCLREIGGLIEQPGIYNFLTGMENLELLNYNHGAQDLNYLLNKFNMKSYLNKKVATYSLGIRQKLGIIEAFLMGNKLVILDEPINALDPISVKEFREAVEHFRNKGVSFLISSHIISETAKVADKILVLNKSQLTEIKMKDNEEKTLIIKTSNDNKLEALLQKDNVEYSLRTNKVMIKCSSFFQAGQYVTKIIKAGIDITYLDLSKDSLENKILKIMGKKMISLINIELKKISKRLQTKIAACILIFFYLAIVIATKYFHAFDSKFAVENSFSTLQFIPIVLIIFTTSSVTVEYQSGAIKTLIYNVKQRYKIVISKFLALVIINFFMYLIILMANILITKYLFSEIASKKILTYASLWVMGYSIENLYLISFAFLLAIIFSNQAISVSLSVISYFLVNLIDGSMFSAIRNYNVLKYNPVNLFNFKMQIVMPSFAAKTCLSLSEFGCLFAIYIFINIILSIFILNTKDF